MIKILFVCVHNSARSQMAEARSIANIARECSKNSLELSVILQVSQEQMKKSLKK